MINVIMSDNELTNATNCRYYLFDFKVERNAYLFSKLELQFQT